MSACMLVPSSRLHFLELRLQVTTADVIPPNFTASTPLVSVVHETDFTLTVQLNKSSCTVYFSVLLYSSAQPSLESVLSGTAPGSLFNGTITAPVVSPPTHPLVPSACQICCSSPAHLLAEKVHDQWHSYSCRTTHSMTTPVQLSFVMPQCLAVNPCKGSSSVCSVYGMFVRPLTMATCH